MTGALLSMQSRVTAASTATAAAVGAVVVVADVAIAAVSETGLPAGMSSSENDIKSSQY